MVVLKKGMKPGSILAVLLVLTQMVCAGSQHVIFVTKTRAEWIAILQQGSSKADAIAQALSVDETFAGALAQAQNELQAIQPKDSINPLWWPLVQKIYLLQKENTDSHPPQDSDLITVFLNR